MDQASMFSLSVGALTVVFSVGGAWGLIRAGIKENTRRIGDLEGSRSKMWEQVNQQGETIASIDSKVDILLDRK